MYGELLTFDDPETRLPAIDRLEGFHPGRSLPLPPRTGHRSDKRCRTPGLALFGEGSLDWNIQER